MQMELLLKASECIIWLCGVTLQGLDTVCTAETTSAEMLSLVLYEVGPRAVKLCRFAKERY
jgi:hypothetical protein